MVTIKKSAMQVKRGRKSHLPLLKDGQLGYCKDTKELYIGNDGKNDLVNPKQTSGGDSSTGGGTITAEYLKLSAPNGREFKVTVSNEGALEVNRFINTVDSPYSGLLINQIYGGGVVEDNATAITHGFIELYNSTNSAINLSGLSVQYCITGNDWKVCELSGMIKAKHSYLIRANRHSEDTSTSVKYVVENCDKDWPITMYNKGIKVCLIADTFPIEVVDPYKEKVEGYIDMIGCGDATMDAAEGLPILGQSKQKAIRRLEGFIDTQDNELDCEIVDYRLADIDVVRPRYSGDGAWDETGSIDPEEDINKFLKLNQIYGGGSDAACSHHFVELYNTHSTKSINLRGKSLFGATYKAPEWQHVDLDGVIPPRHSFLVRGVPSSGAYKLDIPEADLDCTLKLDKAMKVFLIETTDANYLTGIKNPHNVNGAWAKVEGYIDGFGCHGNSGLMLDGSLVDTIDGFETQAPGGGDPGTDKVGCGGNSKQTSMRRIAFTDNDVNSEDFEALRYANYGIDLTLNDKIPRSLSYGPWEADDVIGGDDNKPFSITNTFGEDPKTTRVIKWFTDINEEGTLFYGTSEDNMIEVQPEVVSKEREESFSIHTVSLTELTPATTYVYKVSSGEKFSEVGRFTTEGDEDMFEFIHITDTQGSNAADFKVMADGITAALANSNPDFIIHTGDHIEDKGDSFMRWNAFFKQAEKQFINNALISIPGNNDITSAGDLSEYEERFTFANQCPDCSTAYTFNYGEAIFVCLDSNRKIEEQKVWADTVLKATDRKWKIVLIHAGPYSSIKDDTQILVDMFEENNVHLVLSGHKHMYMRSYKMKNDTNDENGVLYIMGAPCGVKENSSHSMQPWMEVLQAPGMSYNRIKVSNNLLVAEAFKVDGQEIDFISLGEGDLPEEDGNFIVTENGDFLVTENGDKLIY